MVLTNLYPPHFLGGYELKCKLHVEELRARGHDVHVLTSRWKAGQGKVTNKIHRLLYLNAEEESHASDKNLPDPLRLSRRCMQLKWAIAHRKNHNITRDLIMNLKPDIGYIWNMRDVGITPVLALQEQEIPLVFRLGDYWLADLKYTLCLQSSRLRRSYNAAIFGLYDFSKLDLRHLLTVSTALKRHYIEHGFQEQTITVIPNGVLSEFILDAGDLEGTSADQKEITIAQIGRIDPKKGVHIAIQALANLVNGRKHHNIHLEIIGKGSEHYTQELKAICRSLKLEKHVRFVGFMQHRQLLARLPKYTAVVTPSLWEEPLAGIIAESMARGVPVIATNRGGSTEIISNGENGLIVAPGNPGELAEAIERMVQDHDLARSIRCAGLKTVQERYNHEKLMDQIEMQLQEAHHNYQHTDHAPNE